VGTSPGIMGMAQQAVSQLGENVEYAAESVAEGVKDQYNKWTQS
jgi:hypothetical protein